MKNYKTPRGTYDILPKDTSAWQNVEGLIKDVCSVYDYKEIRVPMFEETAVFKRDNDTSDMVNKEMYTFTINNKNYLTLRPEGTAGVIRSYVEHKMYADPDLPVKLYYYGPMFRYERPQKGRQRQFYQFGVENIGVKNPMIDAETIALGYTIVKALGLNRVEVLINTLGDQESRDNYRIALKDHFKNSISELCTDCQTRYELNPLRILDCKIDKDHPKMKTVPDMHEYLTTESKEYFDSVLSYLDALEIPYKVDPQLVRGLDYYTHTVFEVVSLAKESGAQSTIFAGGRYDGLVEYFNGPSQSGVGFAMGIERLMILAEAEGIELRNPDSVDVYVMSMGEVGSLPLVVATELRASGYVTELNVQDKSMKAQFKSVDRFKAKFVVIIGEDEAANKEVTIKNLANREQIKCKVEKMIENIDKIVNEMELEHETHVH
jgi:histidyl-tRNA synthetase